jgi:hypothetical protein
MRVTKFDQRGVGFFATFVLLAVLVAVGLIGYKVVSNTNAKNDVAITGGTSKSAVPKTIHSSADLQQASSALDATNIDSSVNPDQLDADLNALL